jgi:hypothetical protein
VRFETSETITDQDTARNLYPIGNIDVLYEEVVKAFGKARIKSSPSAYYKELYIWHIKIDGKPFILFFKPPTPPKEYFELNNLTKDTVWNGILIDLLILGETPGYKVGNHKTEQQKRWDENTTKELQRYIQVKGYGLSKDSEDMFGGILNAI